MKNQPPNVQEYQRSRTSLWIWVSVAAGLGVVVVSLALLLFLKTRGRSIPETTLVRDARPGKTRSLQPDFALSNSVGIVLGEQESGGGIVHIDSERDGLTAMGSVDGVACRYLDVDPQKKTRATTMGYFYFNLDPSFKRTSVQTVKVEVEYRSDAHGTFGLDYDAMAPTKTAHFIYMHTPPVRLSGATNWQTATFHLKDAAFENSQNGGADFRVWVRPPDLNLRRVTVTRETADTLTEKPAPLNR